MLQTRIMVEEVAHVLPYFIIQVLADLAIKSILESELQALAISKG